MKASTIKLLDRKVGIPICFLLSLTNFNNKPRQRATKKLVFIKLIEQGASVLAYSAIKYSVDKYGKQSVYFLVFSENRHILDRLDILDADNIIEIRQDQLGHFFYDSISALWKLRRIGVDSCVDLEFFSRASAIFAYLMGAKKRVGLHRFKGEQPYRGNLISHRLIYNPYLHVSKYYLLMCQALEEAGGKEPLLKIPPESLHIQHPKLSIDQATLSRVSIKLGLDQNKKLLIFNPNASDMLPLRKWELEKFGELAEELLRVDSEIQLVLTGLQKEKPAIDKLIEDHHLTQAINLAGCTEFSDLMALYEMADLLITNDSGPAHFASLYSCRILVLFGPESPYLYAPLSERTEVVYKNLACSPCVNVYNHRFSPCNDNQCMKTIGVEEVLEKAKEQLKKNEYSK